MSLLQFDIDDDPGKSTNDENFHGYISRTVTAVVSPADVSSELLLQKLQTAANKRLSRTQCLHNRIKRPLPPVTDYDDNETDGETDASVPAGKDQPYDLLSENLYFYGKVVRLSKLF